MPEPEPTPTCLSVIESPFMQIFDEPTLEGSEDGMEEVMDGDLTLSCSTHTRDALRDHSDLLAVESAAAGAIPGLVIDSGSLVNSGLFQPLPAPRSPVELFIDQPVASPHRRVEHPTSASLSEAVASLRREADAQIGTLGELATRLTVTIQEAHSFEQTMQSIGVAAEFRAPFVSAGLDTTFSESSSLRSKTVAVYMYQPLYTISYADETSSRNRDLFPADTDWGADGSHCALFDPEAPPAYIESVTYGRMVVYTVTSEEFHSARDLAVALRASFDAFGVGGSLGVERTEEYQRIIGSSRVEAAIFGGSQDQAFEALRTGDFTALFQPSRSITAVPLVIRAHYLTQGRPLLTLRSLTRYTSRCCTPTNCPPAPVEEQLHADAYLDTGWHFGGTGRTHWGDIGGACRSGWTRGRLNARRTNGRGACEMTWRTDDPMDCRARAYYSRPGSSFLNCSFEIYEQRTAPHPEPLCRGEGDCGLW